MDVSRKSLVKKLWQQPKRLGTCLWSKMLGIMEKGDRREAVQKKPL